MDLDLSKYLDKKVSIELESGDVFEGHIKKMNDKHKVEYVVSVEMTLTKQFVENDVKSIVVIEDNEGGDSGSNPNAIEDFNTLLGLAVNPEPPDSEGD